MQQWANQVESFIEPNPLTAFRDWDKKEYGESRPSANALRYFCEDFKSAGQCLTDSFAALDLQKRRDSMATRVTRVDIFGFPIKSVQDMSS